MGTDSDIRQVLEICKGSYPDALRMVLVANAFYENKIAGLEAEVERLKSQASAGYSRKVRSPKAS